MYTSFIMQRSTIIIAILSFLLASLGGTGVYFGLTMTSGVRDEVHKLRADEYDLTKNNQRTSGLTRLDKSVAALVEKADAQALNTSDEGIILFLGEIESDARIAGVKLESNTPDVAADRSRLRMQVNVSGGYAGVHHFIAIIERLPYLMDLTNVSVGQAGDLDASGAHVYRAQMSFSILSIKKLQ